MVNIQSSNPAKKRAPYQPKLKQPLTIIDIDDALLQKATVVALTGRSPATIDRLVAAGTFPPPIKDGARCTRWPCRGVREWIRAQTAKAAQQQAEAVAA